MALAFFYFALSKFRKGETTQQDFPSYPLLIKIRYNTLIIPEISQLNRFAQILSRVPSDWYHTAMAFPLESMAIWG